MNVVAVSSIVFGEDRKDAGGRGHNKVRATTKACARYTSPADAAHDPSGKLASIHVVHANGSQHIGTSSASNSESRIA